LAAPPLKALKVLSALMSMALPRMMARKSGMREMAPTRALAMVGLSCTIPWVKDGRVKALQNLRYTTRERLLNARTLDDLW
jgi:hypothetical protein